VSETTSPSDTPFTDGEKADIRRYCGYPVVGSAGAGFSEWYCFPAYGALEWKLNGLSGVEYVQGRVYLSQLDSLETGILSAAGSLDTAVAGPWTRNANEIQERSDLFFMWRQKLCRFIGVPDGPGLRRGGGIVV